MTICDPYQPFHYYSDLTGRNANRAEEEAPETITTPQGKEFRQVLNYYLSNRAVYRDNSGRWQLVDQYTSYSVVDYDCAAYVTRCEDLETALSYIDERP